ncbi:MAG: putative bifunctional diguanylate cyclase/phosphodiesterase [Pseudomonadales bacterium]
MMQIEVQSTMHGGRGKGSAARPPKLQVLDSSSETSLEALKARVQALSAAGGACVLKIDESEIDAIGPELSANPLIDFVIKPVSERALAMRLSRLADTVSALSASERELSEMRTELDRLVHYDRVTDLPNYEFFRRYLAFQVRHASRFNRQLAVLAVDLRSLGRHQGTLDPEGIQGLLLETSRRLVRELRGYDLVGQAPSANERMLTRLEGDRFLVLLSEVRQLGDVTGIVERMLDAVSEPVAVGNVTIRPAPRVGISLYPEDGGGEQDLIRNAISALAFSSDHKLDRFGFFAASINEQIADRNAMEGQLMAAIAEGAFEIRYQPKVSLETGKVTGFEALLRWEDAKLGVVAPSKFVPLAEEIGVVTDITRFVVRSVCRQIRQWQGEGIRVPTVAINLSGQDLLRTDFANFVTEQLLEHEVPPRNLEFEITESAFIDDLETSTRLLENLRYIGVRVSLDDFGTGYSSLSYLQRMPVDTVKIDRSFIRNVTSDWNSAAIASGIITLSHILSLNVVAEGVETEEQLQLLKDQRCNEVQGAYYSMPLPADQARRWM